MVQLAAVERQQAPPRLQVTLKLLVLQNAASLWHADPRLCSRASSGCGHAGVCIRGVFSTAMNHHGKSEEQVPWLTAW